MKTKSLVMMMAGLLLTVQVQAATQIASSAGCESLATETATRLTTNLWESETDCNKMAYVVEVTATNFDAETQKCTFVLDGKSVQRFEACAPGVAKTLDTIHTKPALLVSTFTAEEHLRHACKGASAQKITTERNAFGNIETTCETN